jgi:hypothetical protein
LTEFSKGKGRKQDQITKFSKLTKLRRGFLTGKHEIMKTGRRQGKFWDRINMIKRIGEAGPN